MNYLILHDDLFKIGDIVQFRRSKQHEQIRRVSYEADQKMIVTNIEKIRNAEPAAHTQMLYVFGLSDQKFENRMSGWFFKHSLISRLEKTELILKYI